MFKWISSFQILVFFVFPFIHLRILILAKRHLMKMLFFNNPTSSTIRGDWRYSSLVKLFL